MASARPFLSRIIDYAGLFPPARLTMHETVSNYHAYRASPDQDLLGRLIVPIERLVEFGEVARSFLPKEENAEPWHLSVVATQDFATATKSLLEFNCGHWRGSEHGHASVASVEAAVRDVTAINAASAAFSRSFELFLEIPAGQGAETLISSIASAGARAKIRTGGVTSDKFPSAAAVARFIATCHRHGVKFKATAGLHHPLQGRYPLTYEHDSEVSGMFGYLNLVVATAFIQAGLSEEIAANVLTESDAGAVRFDANGVAWKSYFAATASIHAAREQLALSFGSCSFDDPVNEARALGYI